MTLLSGKNEQNIKDNLSIVWSSFLPLPLNINYNPGWPGYSYSTTTTNMPSSGNTAYSASDSQNAPSNLDDPSGQGRRRKMFVFGALVVFVCVCVGGFGFWANLSNSSTRSLSGESKTKGAYQSSVQIGSKVLSNVLRASSVARIRQNRPLLVGSAVAIVALVIAGVVVGVYFWPTNPVDKADGTAVTPHNVETEFLLVTQALPQPMIQLFLLTQTRRRLLLTQTTLPTKRLRKVVLPGA
jgi:hypothetical protein